MAQHGRSLNLCSKQRCGPTSWLAATSLNRPLPCSSSLSICKMKELGLQASSEFVSSRGCYPLSWGLTDQQERIEETNKFHTNGVKTEKCPT